MANTTIDNLLQENVQDASKIIFSNGSQLTKRDDALSLANLANSLNTVDIFSESDFPAPVGGFIRLANNTQYNIKAQITLTNPFLWEAGVLSIITSEFPQVNNIIFTGAEPAVQSLNLSDSITAFADSDVSPGVKTKVTSAAHGLVDNDKVNIFNVVTETIYNGTRFTISNVTTNTFDIEIIFTNTDTGDFDTGPILVNIGVGISDGTGLPGTQQAFDLIFTKAIGDFRTSFTISANISVFDILGSIREAQFFQITNGFLEMFTEGLILDNIQNIRLAVQLLQSSNSGGSGTMITITGPKTEFVIIQDVRFNMASAAEFPMRIDPSIASNADIEISIAPDNDVATDYFDTSSGGLDETDPRINARIGGNRKSSITAAEGRTSGILEVDGSGGVDVPVVDITPVSGDWIEDSATERFTVDPTTGLITYNGLNPKIVQIKYEISAAQTSGANQTIQFDIHINGISQSKSERTLITEGVGGFLPVIYNGGIFTINPGDTIQLFKENITNTNNTDVSDAVLLITITE